MGIKVHIIHAFTDTAGIALGNPAGVVVTPGALTEGEMAQIAVMAAQPMTAFAVPRTPDGTQYDLRYYDMGGRPCHICGHATVAVAAHLVQNNSQLQSKELSFYLDPSLFDGQQKILKTRTQAGKIEIDLFPSTMRQEKDPALIQALAHGLNIREEDIGSIAFSTNVRDYVVILKDSDTLLNLKPDFDFLKKMAEKGPWQHEGLMVSAPATPGSGYDVFNRAFLPITGVNEDVACGSCNCSTIPWLVQQGFNGGMTRFRTLFPFPPGPAGYVGGVQDVVFDPGHDRITITCQAKTKGLLDVDVKSSPSGNNRKPEPKP